MGNGSSNHGSSTQGTTNTFVESMLTMLQTQNPNPSSATDELKDIYETNERDLERFVAAFVREHGINGSNVNYNTLSKEEYSLVDSLMNKYHHELLRTALHPPRTEERLRDDLEYLLIEMHYDKITEHLLPLFEEAAASFGTEYKRYLNTDNGIASVEQRIDQKINRIPSKNITLYFSLPSRSRNQPMNRFPTVAQKLTYAALATHVFNGIQGWNYAVNTGSQKYVTTFAKVVSEKIESGIHTLSASVTEHRKVRELINIAATKYMREKTISHTQMPTLVSNIEAGTRSHVRGMYRTALRDGKSLDDAIAVVTNFYENLIHIPKHIDVWLNTN